MNMGWMQLSFRIWGAAVCERAVSKAFCPCQHTDGSDKCPWSESAEKYGVERIVPARELSLSEIRRMKEETGLEIECFVHGALCYSYSGQCLFSSMLGGRSGNRGQCAQPCRLRYQAEGQKDHRAF